MGGGELRTTKRKETKDKRQTSKKGNEECQHDKRIGFPLSQEAQGRDLMSRF